jgi:NADH-quinone oxidoreductase subunit A
MQETAGNTTVLWPLVVYTAIVLSLVLLILGLSYVLGQRGQARATGEPYEGGIISAGGARMRFSSQFYMVAMLFVIFDVETIFILSWAIAFRELGWYGYVGVLVFIVLLVVVLVYEWRNGALDFGPDGKKILAAYKRMTQKPELN